MTNEGAPGDLDVTDELIAERHSGEPGETPPDMNPRMRSIIWFIDRLNLWIGRFTCLLVVPIITVMVWEVVARKLFLAPTDFAYEYSRMLAGAMFMLGAGYALMRGVHIRADFLYRHWTRSTQSTVDASLYLLLYFPAMLLFFWVSLNYTTKAWITWERSMDTAMMAPLAPARTAMPIAAFLLFLQGISELLKCLYEMTHERRRMFLRIIPVYAVGLVLMALATFRPDLAPGFPSLAPLAAALGLDGLATEWIGLVMIAVMLFSIFVGFPISFTLIFLGFAFGAWGFSSKLTFHLQTFQFNSTMLDDQLVAVPLFVFMGIMMERAGLMERLFTSIQLMFSRTHGALYVAVLAVSTVFAAATGIVGASVTMLGIMAARSMNRSGYDVRLSSGAITAGGTLGILIPPSIMLVVMGPVLEVPVTDLFAAAIIPGIMLAALYMGYTLVRCRLNGSLGPILPESERPETSPYYFLEFVLAMAALVGFCWLAGLGISGRLGALFTGAGLLLPVAWIGGMCLVYRWTRANKPGGFYFSELWKEFLLGLAPPTALVAFALGAILLGWATPAEAAATGALGSVLLSLGYRKFNIPDFYGALVKTLEITVLIMFLVAASNFFGAVFSRLGTPTMLTELILAWDLNQTLVLIIVMALIFLLGWPLEWVPIVLIIVPILVPALIKLDVNLTWFGILVAVNLQTAWLTPPVALSAYFLKGVVPEWDLKDIYFGMMQFTVIQLFGLVLVFSFPQIALWLPEQMYGN